LNLATVEVLSEIFNHPGSGAGSYIVRFKKVLQSWLSYNYLEIKFKLNIAREYDSPTLMNEKEPSKEELDKILRMATPRARVSISLMAFSGLRPGSLGNYVGTDGLRIGDLPELEMGGDSVEPLNRPLVLVVRKSLSKSSVDISRSFRLREPCILGTT